MNDQASLVRLDRLQVLESETRALRARLRTFQQVGVVALLAAAILLVAGASYVRQVDEIRARRFVLEDSSGEPRATLGIGPDGAASFALVDNKQQPRIQVSLSKHGVAALELRDEAQKKGIRLATNADGSSWLIFADGVGDKAVEKSRINLGMSTDGNVRLDFRAQNEPMKVLFKAESAKNNATRICVNDDKGDRRIQLATVATGVAAINVFERDRGRFIALGACARGEGGPSLSIHDAERRLIAGLTVRRDGIPQMMLWDDEHHAFYKTPTPNGSPNQQSPIAPPQNSGPVSFSLPPILLEREFYVPPSPR